MVSDYPRTRASARVVLLASLAALAACASGPVGQVVGPAPEMPRFVPPPVDLPDTVVYLGVDLSDVPRSIGAHHDGLLHTRQAPNTLTADLENTWHRWTREIGAEMLADAGYPLRELSGVFASLESYDGVALVLGGEMLDLGFDTYAPLAGNETKAEVAIRWELLDMRSRRVIYSRRTSAAVTTSGISGDAFAQAVRYAFAKLLADRDLVEAIEAVSTPTVAGGAPDARFRREFPSSSDLIDLPQSDQLVAQGSNPFDVVSPAVVSLRGERSLGTAFLLSRDGLALTNHHVVDGESELTAVFGDRRELPVRVLRSDANADVALLEIACVSDCMTVELGSATDLDIGAALIAIGTPLSETLSHTVTRGIVSGRRLSSGVTLLQTDAALNPGNSGGPIIDPETSRVVAIATMKLEGEGLGFGVAVEDALRVLGVNRRR